VKEGGRGGRERERDEIRKLVVGSISEGETCKCVSIRQHTSAYYSWQHQRGREAHLRLYSV
jgi:hypothetical protein